MIAFIVHCDVAAVAVVVFCLFLSPSVCWYRQGVIVVVLAAVGTILVALVVIVVAMIEARAVVIVLLLLLYSIQN